MLFVSCNDKYNNDLTNFTAEPEHKSTKTHLEPNSTDRIFEVIWDSDDDIMVYGDDESNGIYTNTEVYDDNNNQVAHFSGSGVTGTNYYSFYPASIASSQSTFILPETQTYRARTNGYVYNYPMYAQESGSTHLYFKNLCSLCILRIKGTTGTVINKVTVVDPSDPVGEPIAGEFSVTCSGSTQNNNPTVTAINPTGKTILDCTSSPVTLTNDISLFYVYLPPSEHKWLLIGVEYIMPGETEVNTTYQTIYAESYSEDKFKFKRSQWTPIDIDFSGLDGSLMYSVNNVTLTGNDTVINTNVPITRTYDNYTILIDFTPTDLSRGDIEDGTNAIRKTLYSEMDKNNPWRGMLVRITHSGTTIKIELAISNSRVESDLTISANTRYKIAIVMNADAGKAYLYYMQYRRLRNKSMSIGSNKWVSTTNPAPQIGGDQHKSTRYFIGTIHEFKIYNEVFSTNQLQTWFNS